MSDAPAADEREIPEDVAQDLDVLMNFLVNPALDMLQEHGEIYPYAGYLAEGGRCHPVEDEEAGGEPEEVLERLRARLAEVVAAGGVLATGIVLHVEVENEELEEPVDAIGLEVEHASGESHMTFVLYGEEDGRLEAQDIWSEEADPRGLAKRSP